MNAWDVFWFLFVFIPLGILWVLIFVDLMGRRDLVGWQKAIWAMVVMFFPWIGIFAYLLTRPREAVWPAFATGPTGPAPAPQTAAPQQTPRVPPPQPTGEMPAAQA
jgi:hypothetical protein